MQHLLGAVSAALLVALFSHLLVLILVVFSITAEKRRLGCSGSNLVHFGLAKKVVLVSRFVLHGTFCHVTSFFPPPLLSLL